VCNIQNWPLRAKSGLIEARLSLAMPGNSSRVDLYGGLRGFMISAKRKEMHNERIPAPEGSKSKGSDSIDCL